MRFFYDTYSSLRRADLALLAADGLTTAAAFFFASAVIERHDAAEAAYLGAWALIPRSTAKFLAWCERQREVLKSFWWSALLLVSISVLAVAGWDLLLGRSSLSPHVREGTALLMLACWGCGFLLCFPRSYRLHDFLLLAVVLLGLVEQRPLPLVWVPAALLGLAASSLLRRVVFDVAVEVVHPRVNLQNVRALALATALPASLGFVLVTLGLWPFLDAHAPREEVVEGSAASGGGGRGNGGFPGGEAKWTAAAAQSEGFGASGGASGPSTTRRVGLTHRVRLRDLAPPRYDDRVVLRVREPSGFCRLSERTLWKAVSLSRFDPSTSSWSEALEFERRERDADGVIRLRARRSLEPTPSLTIEIVTPVLQTLIAPYFPVAFELLDPPAAGEHFLVNAHGDVYPRPRLGAGARYLAALNPCLEDSEFPLASDVLVPPDLSCLEVPSRNAVGVDLEDEAHRIFTGELGLGSQVQALRKYFSLQFRASNAAAWRSGATALGDFFAERVGDCTYFATAATLLLRAAGVPARLAVGFAGGAWEEDPANGQRYFVVRNSSAHAWVEVHVQPGVWYPLDPTAWAGGGTASLLASSRRAVLADDGSHRGDAARNGAADGAASGGRWAPDDSRSPDTRARLPATRDGARSGGASGSTDASPAGRGGAPGRGIESDASGWIQVEQLAGEPGLDGLLTAKRPAGDAESPTGDGAWSAPADSARSAWSLLGRLAVCMGLGVAVLLVLMVYLRPRPRPANSEEDETAPGVSPGGALPLDGAHEFVPTNTSEAVLKEYQVLQQDLERTRNHRRAPETPLEHGQRFAGRSTALDAAFAALHKLVYFVLYGGRSAQGGDLDAARKSCRRIRRHLG